MRSSFLVLLVLAAARSAWAQDEDCRKCHDGQDPKAPRVKLDPASAHGEMECLECHAGVEKPCRKGMKPTPCKTCHDDQASNLSKSSHGPKMAKDLAARAPGGKAGADASCRACHTESTHTLRKVKDPGSGVARGHVSEACLACHEKSSDVAVGGYRKSVHHAAVAAGKTEAATCIDCHGAHSVNHSQDPKSRAHHLAIPATCGHCHKEEKARFLESSHWKAAQQGFREAPVCTDCHGEHAILAGKDPSSATYAGNVTKTCSACHASQKLASKFMLKADRVESFQDSFHGLSMRLGDVRVAHCASCHGAHGVLPSSDPRSRTNPANLGKTCGGCHPGAATRFAFEKVHITSKDPSHWVVGLVRNVYLWLIVLTVGGMLLHNFLDLRYKAMRGEPCHRTPGLAPRFSVNERLQHAALAASFIVLAISGFALKYPQSPFSWPFQALNGGADVRRWSHRAAAFVFMGLAIYHMVYLALAARGRAQFRALQPRWEDVKDSVRILRLYFGGSGPKPTVPAFAYPEKAEYWALVWGSVIMTVTGLVLLFVNLSLSRLPFWVVDLALVIHLMEAILAGLAILVWHGYWVVFAPETYPLNLTFLIGEPRPVRREGAPPPEK
jgi:cytochrome b subunit of formate dehydrogenase